MDIEVNRNPEHRIPAGMPVFDVDTADEGKKKLIVVNHPDEPCEEFRIDNIGQTVAEINPEYSPDAPVVQAVYAGQLDAELQGWPYIPPENLLEAVEDFELRVYSYPARRLASLTSILPGKVDTYWKLICYQCARMTHLSVLSNEPDRNPEKFMWTNFWSRVNGYTTMSSVLKENKYQLKENLGHCSYCHQEAETTFDHIIPKSRGGPDDMKNMVPVCSSCNSSKSNKNVIDWHQEHDLPIDRVVLGKYLKIWKEQLEDEDRLKADVTEEDWERWDQLPISRKISQTVYMDHARD